MHMPDWHCRTCGRFSILGGEVDDASYERQQLRIAEHTGHHDIQLAEHNGDVESHQQQLKYPALHAALKKLAEKVINDGAVRD